MTSRDRAVQKFRALIPEWDTFVQDGLAQDMTNAKKRGEGEGRLFLTKTAVFHWPDDDADGPTCITNWTMMLEAKHQWAPAPGMRILHFSTIHGRYEFLTSKRMAQTVVDMANQAIEERRHTTP